MEAGDYDMEIYVYYYDKQAQKQMRVELPELEKKAPKTESPLLMIVIVLLGVILLVNLAWFFVSLRNKSRKKNKKKK